MKLQFINKDIVEPVMSYGVPVKFGSVIDSSVWGDKEDHIVAKALSTKNWKKAADDAQVTDGLVVVEEEPVKKGGKRK